MFHKGIWGYFFFQIVLGSSQHKMSCKSGKYSVTILSHHNIGWVKDC